MALANAFGVAVYYWNIADDLCGEAKLRSSCRHIPTR